MSEVVPQSIDKCAFASCDRGAKELGVLRERERESKETASRKEESGREGGARNRPYYLNNCSLSLFIINLLTFDELKKKYIIYIEREREKLSASFDFLCKFLFSKLERDILHLFLMVS